VEDWLKKIERSFENERNSWNINRKKKKPEMIEPTYGDPHSKRSFKI
ncbi:5185_t:CDS:1, partial [Scutellospora calospora]